MNQKRRKLARFSFAFLITGVSIKALSVTFSVFPVLLSALITALTESLPSGLFHFPSQPVHTTQSPPLSLSLSLSLSLFLPAPLYFTSSHLLIDLYSFQGFPSALLSIAAPITACCTADRRATSCALTLFSLAISLPLSRSLSLFLTHL